MRTVTVPALWLVAALVLSGCAGAAAVPDGEADLVGEITAVTPAACGDVLGTVLVEAQPGVQGTAAMSFTVTADTVIGLDYVSLDEREIVESGFDALHVGAEVSAWSSGPIAESYPGQAEAAHLLFPDPGS